ncbi:MAG TPA: hypothetical protein ENL27_01295 [Candidatus Parcubacteria bacterium]|nr:hypothetical protein [Candidatus Parcubacteria bacterium]
MLYFYLKNDKGISAFLALLVLSIFLAMSLGLSTILLFQYKEVKEMGDSVKAFYAADTGIEEVLYRDKKCYEPGCASLPWECVDTAECSQGIKAGSFSKSFGASSPSYEVLFNNGAWNVHSKGSYEKASRAVHISR